MSDPCREPPACSAHRQGASTGAAYDTIGGHTSCRTYDVSTMSASPSRPRPVTAFFVGLGLEVEAAWTPSSASPLRSHIVTLRPPTEAQARALESGRTTSQGHPPPWRLRNVSFEVDDLRATVDQLAADGYGLVGSIGQYENIWRMAYVRRPQGAHRFPWRMTPDPGVRPSPRTARVAARNPRDQFSLLDGGGHHRHVVISVASSE